MKTATVVVLLLFLCGLASAANEPVLDAEGEELKAGVEYFVVSFIWGAGGGGLALGRTADQKCPEIVIQRRSDLDRGFPVIFSNSDPNDEVIRLSTDININFTRHLDRLCTTSTVWKVDDFDNSAGKWWITTDGVSGNPGPNTLTSWFKIKTKGPGYKFTFCPSVCESCTTLCSDIALDVDDDGQRRLALAADGYAFVFIKASSTIKQVVSATH